MFSNTERTRVREQFPGLSIGEVAKELGRRWTTEDKGRYEKMAAIDRQRYDEVREGGREGGSIYRFKPV